MAKDAIKKLIILVLKDFDQIFCKQFYDDRNLNKLTPTSALRFDRNLHELIQWLENSESIEVNGVLIRVKQSISLLLVENQKEGRELVEEWKNSEAKEVGDGQSEGCKLRAGEILSILNKLPE